MSMFLRQWCGICAAATPTYICPGCHQDRCGEHERATKNGYCPVTCEPPEEWD